MTPLETLQHIQHRLASESPGQIIDALLPQTASGALTWARRLSGWEEHPFPSQVIGLARVISKQAIRAYGMQLTKDGRVVESGIKPWRDAKPERTFKLAIAGEEIQVAYTPDYFPHDDTALFYFTNTEQKPHCLSDSGYLSQFVPRDIVDACGGPEAFAAQFAEARMRGEAKEFMAAFEGKPPEPSRRKVARPAKRPVVGEHTANVIADPEPGKQSEQGMLF